MERKVTGILHLDCFWSSCSNALTQTFHSVRRWFMPVNIAITFVAGGILGWIACNILKPPQHFRGLIISFCSSGSASSPPQTACLVPSSSYMHASWCWCQWWLYCQMQEILAICCWSLFRLCVTRMETLSEEIEAFAAHAGSPTHHGCKNNGDPCCAILQKKSTS
jgi:hypothetical protein